MKFFEIDKYQTAEEIVAKIDELETIIADPKTNSHARMIAQIDRDKLLWRYFTASKKTMA